MLTPPPGSVAIIGPGLLGGSIALALRERAPATALRIWARRDTAVTEIVSSIPLSFGSTDIRAVCDGADFIVLCTPVTTMPALAREIVSAKLGKHCVVTDVGSVKTTVVAELENIFANSAASYTGSHPMAGSENSGLTAARADLFQGAACILTATLFSTDESLNKIKSFWHLLGARTIEMTPEEHDRRVARISHLPHLVAAVVTRAALREDAGTSACAGNGFRDATRIASGDPDLWTGIALENRAEILTALRAAHAELGDLLAMLDKVDEKALRHFLAEAKTLRDLIT